MKTVKVDFEVQVNDEATTEQIGGWLRFELFGIGVLPHGNPMAKQVLSVNLATIRIISDD